MFIKKFYGPLEVVSIEDGRYMAWFNQDGEKVFELTGGTDISIKYDYFYLLINFLYSLLVGDDNSYCLSPIKTKF
jgi:hypothetical protein